MLKYFNKLIGRTDGVVGLDFGSRCLKAVQVAPGDAGVGLVAAGALPVPDGLWESAAALRSFLRGPVRRLLTSGGFRGRNVALALPAREMHACSTREGNDGSGGGNAVCWLPFSPGEALFRQVEGGDVYDAGVPRREVVTLAVRRAAVRRVVDAAAGAGLNVVSVLSEPEVLLRALAHAYGPESGCMRILVDLGYEGTRVYAGVGRRLMFARCLRPGGRQLARQISAALGVAAADSCALRAALPALEPGSPRPHDALLRRVDESCDAIVEELAQELRLCHHYLSAAFPATPAHHLIFVGGGARHRRLCQRLAEGVGLPFRSANSLSRLHRAAPANILKQLLGAEGAGARGEFSAAVGLSLTAIAAQAAPSTERAACADAA